MKVVAAVALLTLVACLLPTDPPAARDAVRDGSVTGATGGAQGSGPAKTVRALRYRVFVYDSALHVVHRAGRWVEEIYFPDSGVVCNVHAPMGRTLAVNAFPSGIRNRVKLHPRDEELSEQPVEEIEVPADLAEEIFAMAAGRVFSYLPTALAARLLEEQILRVPNADFGGALYTLV